MPYMKNMLHYVTKKIFNKYLKNSYNLLTFQMFLIYFKTNYEVSTPISLKTYNKKPNYFIEHLHKCVFST